MYRQLASVLEQQFGHQYPDLVISGENYNPGSFRLEISQVIGMVKMIIIAMVVFNFNPWVYMELGPTPSFVSWALENKIYACLMTFFLINAVETQLISSGAFEVTVNGEKGKRMQFKLLVITQKNLFSLVKIRVGRRASADDFSQSCQREVERAVK